MFKKFMLAAAVCVVCSPMLYCEMPSGSGMGMGGRGMGDDSFRSGSGRHGNDSKSDQGKKQAAPAPVTTDNVNDILTFKNKLGLTGQQVISIDMIRADAQQEAAVKSNAVREYQQKLAKSLSQSKPDFADIRDLLSKLTEAQANMLALPVDTYEKAYNLLADDQKEKLAFFRSQRQQEIEKNAAAAQESQPAPSQPSPSLMAPPSSLSSPSSLINH